MRKSIYIHPLLDLEAAAMSLLVATDVPILALSRGGDVLVMNWRIQALTGFGPARALQGQFLQSVMSDDDAQAALSLVTDLLDGKEMPENVEWRFRKDGGPPRQVSFQALVLRDSGSDPIGALLVGLPPARRSAPAFPDATTTLPQGDLDGDIATLVFRIDISSRRVTSMNRAVEHVLGYGAQDFLDDPKLLVARVLPEYHEAFQAALEDALRGVARSIEVGFARRDNHTVILALMLYPSRDLDRNVLSVEGIGRDITVRKEMEEQLARSLEDLQSAYDRLQAQHEELQSLDRLKSQVLANVSHELRTPLVTIRGYNELMLQEEMGSLTERQRKGLEISAKSIQRLLALIENLIDFARLEKDRFKIPRKPLDLVDVVTAAVAACSENLNIRDLRVNLDLGSGPAVVLGDRARLMQAVRNLIDNAEKFCAPGGEVVVRVLRDEQEVVVEVGDTGIGIPSEEQERIFDTFYQVDGSTTRPYPGLGIGLAIVKEVAELHGGSIQVQSEVGTGSTFRILLPAWDDDDQAEFSSNAHAPTVEEEEDAMD